MTDLIPRDAALSLQHRLSPSLDAADGYYVSVDALRAIPTTDPAATREAALETPEFSRLVEEAKNAVEVLRFAVTDIQDLENTLSSYRQNWTDADAAANSLSAAILALIGEKK